MHKPPSRAGARSRMLALGGAEATVTDQVVHVLLSSSSGCACAFARVSAFGASPRASRPSTRKDCVRSCGMIGQAALRLQWAAYCLRTKTARPPRETNYNHKSLFAELCEQKNNSFLEKIDLKRILFPFLFPFNLPSILPPCCYPCEIVPFPI